MVDRLAGRHCCVITLLMVTSHEVSHMMMSHEVSHVMMSHEVSHMMMSHEVSHMSCPPPSRCFPACPLPWRTTARTPGVM